MQTAIAAFIRFYNDSGTIAQWQNFFVGKTVDGYAYKAFDIGSVIMNRSAAESGLSIVMPTTGANLSLVEEAIEALYLMRLTLYEWPNISSVPSIGGEAVGAFVGEIIDASVNEKRSAWKLHAMDAVTETFQGEDHH